MPWSASASPKNFLNNNPSNSPNPKTPNSCAISEAISHEIQHVRSAIGSAFGKPKTPTSPAKSPFYQPKPASAMHRHAAMYGHPLTPAPAPSSPIPRSGGPRTADPRLCQFPASPRSPRSPRPSPRPPQQQLPTGAARPSTPHAYSISERRVITLDDPPRYESRSRQPPRPLNLRAGPPISASLTASGYRDEKSPSVSPYHPRQPPPRLPPRGNHHQTAPHTAHPLGSFPRHPDSYHRSQRSRNDGSLTAKPEPETKRSGFQFEIGSLKFNIPSPLSGKTDPKSTGTPQSARPRDTRRFGYYEYKTPVTSEFHEVKLSGDVKYQDGPNSAVLFDDRGYPMTPKSARPHGEVVFPVPEYGAGGDLEKGTGEKQPRPGFMSVKAWRMQIKSLRERFQRPRVQTDRIPSFDGEAEPQTLEQIEKNVRKTNVMSWTTLAGAWLMQFTTFGYIWTWNVFQDYYMNEHGKVHTVNKLAWIGSTQLFLCFAFGIVSGKLLDAGYFYVATYLGSLVFGLGLFVLSFLDPSKFAPLFLVQGLLIGCGLGLVFLPSATICMFHFKERKALMTGIAMSGSCFGAMIYPIMLDQLLSKPQGFQAAVRSSSYMVIALLVIANCLIAKPPKIWAPKFPPVDLVLYLRERHYYLTCIGIFFGTLALWFPQNYIEEYGVKHSVDPNICFYSVAIIGVTGFLGRIAMGVAAERLGPWNLLIPVTVGSFVMTCAMTGMITVGSVAAVSLFYGFFSGAWLSLLVTALASLALRPGEIGHRVGLAMTVGSLGALFSVPTHTSLVGTEFVFPRAIGLMVFIMIVVIALFVYIRMLIAQKRRFQYV